jgi:hypothetical protein
MSDFWHASSTRLRERALANRHRRERERILRTCNADLRAWLEPASIVTGVEVGSIVRSWPWPLSTFNAKPTALRVPRLSNWNYLDFDVWGDLVAAAAEIPRMPSGPAHLLLPSGPLFCVDMAEGRKHLGQLLEFVGNARDETLAIVLTDRSRGIAIDDYAGYLPEDRRANYDEVVYQLAWW